MEAKQKGDFSCCRILKYFKSYCKRKKNERTINLRRNYLMSGVVYCNVLAYFRAVRVRKGPFARLLKLLMPYRRRIEHVFALLRFSFLVIIPPSSLMFMSRISYHNITVVSRTNMIEYIHELII